MIAAVLALAAAGALAALLRWRGRLQRPARVAAVFLVVEAGALLWVGASEHMDAPALVAASLIAMLVTSLAATTSLAAFALEERRPLEIAGAACWAIAWLLNATILVWVIRYLLGGDLDDAPAAGLVPAIAGGLGGGLLAVAALRRGEGRCRGVLLACYIGFAIVWLVGDWRMLEATEVDAETIRANRLLADVGVAGARVMLGALLWRAVRERVPTARVVSGRRRSP